MTRTLLMACAIALLMSPFALAETRSGCQASSESTEIFGQDQLIAADQPLCEDLAVDMAGFPITPKTTCIVDCVTFAIGCTTVGNCTAIERDCSVGVPGFVFCDPFLSACPSCQCLDGQTRLMSSSDCCCNYEEDPDEPTLQGKVLEQTCVDGVWVTTGFNCDGPDCEGPECEV